MWTARPSDLNLDIELEVHWKKISWFHLKFWRYFEVSVQIAILPLRESYFDFSLELPVHSRKQDGKSSRFSWSSYSHNPRSAGICFQSLAQDVQRQVSIHALWRLVLIDIRILQRRFHGYDNVSRYHLYILKLCLNLISVSKTTRKLTIGTNSDLEFSSMSPKSTCRQ